MIKNNKGFTLIELLIVISIIGILAVIVMISVNGTRKSARDARRTAEIDSLFNALEMCYGDQGNYPDGNVSPFDFWNFGQSNPGGCRSVHSCDTCWGVFTNAIYPCVKRKDIMDPINKDPNSYYYFYFGSSCTFYKNVTRVVNPKCYGHYAIMAILETPQYDNSSIGCFNSDPGTYAYWRVLGL